MVHSDGPKTALGPKVLNPAGPITVLLSSLALHLNRPKQRWVQQRRIQMVQSSVGTLATKQNAMKRYQIGWDGFTKTTFAVSEDCGMLRKKENSFSKKTESWKIVANTSLTTV